MSMYTYLHIFICEYIYMYIYMCIYIYVLYMHTFIYI